MIDLRVIKCDCGKPECIMGISFDFDGELLLRFHDKHDREQTIRLKPETVKELINELKPYTKKK